MRRQIFITAKIRINYRNKNQQLAQYSHRWMPGKNASMNLWLVQAIFLLDPKTKTLAIACNACRTSQYDWRTIICNFRPHPATIDNQLCTTLSKVTLLLTISWQLTNYH